MALRLTSELMVRPNACFLCNQPPSVCGQCVDTGKTVGKGMSGQRVYLCAECAQDIIKELGLTRPKDADKAIAAAEALEEQIADLEEKNADLQAKLEAVSNDLVKSVLASAKPTRKRTTTAKKKTS